MEYIDMLGITSLVPKGAKVLLVDMQEAFIVNLDVSKDVKRQLFERVYDMKSALMDLKEKCHEIYATVDSEYDGGKIHPVLEGVVDTYLPAWASKTFIPDYKSFNPIHHFELHADVIKAFGPEDEVIVCGLWRETALSVVTQLLKYEGIVARLSINPALSIELLCNFDKKVTA